MSARTGHWWPAAATVFACGWGGNQFTPLLVMYRANGWSTVTVDALLGAYVFGLVPGLLTAGTLSERWGRRRVMIGGTVLSVLASVLLTIPGVAWIAAGRFVTGLGAAAAMAVGTVWVAELSRARGASHPVAVRRGALWLTLGFGLGAGIAGVLAQWGPWPMVLPYVVHAVCASAALVVALRTPETRPVPTGPSDQRLRGRLAGMRHPRFLRVVLPMAPWIFGSAGVAYAVMPQLVGDRVGSWGLAYSTLLVVCTLGAGALVQPFVRRLDRPSSARAVIVAMLVMTAGMVAGTLAAVVRSPVVALLAAVTLGVAYGIALVAGLQEIGRIAHPDNIAPLTGAYYALAYLGFLVPSILAVLSSVAGYDVLLAGLALVALAGSTVVLRYSRAHLPRLEY
ncbi:MFS transporter [Pseudonocardia endophytica]|uniref:Putative MFS family arabinose efflux permease n=1 Tax=Pseudonocardia endophytica TaxID=401976 RepID=A0A4R1HTR8_PSEEN|nr:MFS transporter [Pseudonocardia endophytica]TCK26067.1 putative MFS family arabinose efflux permease [Pseudonocardia endophytica]